MKVSVSNLQAAKASLDNLNALPFPISVSFALIRNTIALEPLWKAVDTQVLKLAQKYGTPQKDGGYVIGKEMRGQYQSDLSAFMVQEFDVELTQIPMTDFESVVGATIRPNDLMGIRFMINGDMATIGAGGSGDS